MDKYTHFFTTMIIRKLLQNHRTPRSQNEVNDVVEVEGKRIHIVEMVGRRISKVKLEKLPETPPTDKSGEGSD